MTSVPSLDQVKMKLLHISPNLTKSHRSPIQLINEPMKMGQSEL